MKSIKTEDLFVSYKQNQSLENIFTEAEKLLLADKKKPLRMVLLEISGGKVKLLVSFMYEK